MNKLSADHFTKNENNLLQTKEKMKFIPLLDDIYISTKDTNKQKNKNNKIKKSMNVNQVLFRDNKYRDIYNIENKLSYDNKHETNKIDKNKKMKSTEHAITISEWTNKYKPKKISDLLINYEENTNLEKKNICNTTKKITEWLKNYKNTEDLYIKKKYKKKTTKKKKKKNE